MKATRTSFPDTGVSCQRLNWCESLLEMMTFVGVKGSVAEVASSKKSKSSIIRLTYIGQCRDNVAMSSQTSTKGAEPSVMEYFILALIGKAGLKSLYAFQQRAGLQPGGIRTSLQRLESWQLITRAESSTRQRKDMSLTAEGIEVLNNTWKRCLGERTDPESVLRVACIALLMGVPGLAVGCLADFAFDRRFTAKEKSMEADTLQKTKKGPLSTYVWMRARSEAQRHNAESEVFSQLSRFLEETNQPDGENQS